MITDLQPHQQRVVDERRELDERRQKLSEFIRGDVYLSLPVQERSLLRKQAKVMRQYSDLLGERIAVFIGSAS